MVDLLHHFISLLFFWYAIIISWYYINLRSSIIFCLSSGDIFLSLWISLKSPILCSSFVTELFCGDVFGTIGFSSAISLLIKSPIASAVFWIALFEKVLSASSAWSRTFRQYLLPKFLHTFLPLFFLYL